MLLSACHGSESPAWDDPGPKRTFERFLMNWFQNNRSEAFEMLEPGDREVLTESLGLVDENLDGGTPEPHEMLVAGRVDNPYDLARIEVDPKLKRPPEQGREVTLTLIYHDGRRGEATMVWGGERWYVDLPLGARASTAETEDEVDALGRGDDAGTAGTSGEGAAERNSTMDATTGESRE